MGEGIYLQWKGDVVNVQYITNIGKVDQIPSRELTELREVTQKFAFRSNDYYLSLIDWDDPDDPIRRIAIPHPDELFDWGRLDPSNENKYMVIKGLEHKYSPTALFIVNNVCGNYCRYCFRKRIFLSDRSETLQDIPRAVEYVKSHREITNVLLTGGDPLMSSTRRLEEIISRLAKIGHVRIIRLGSKLPAFNPYRIIDDPALCEMIHRYSRGRRKIYIMTHFSHPRELTDIAIKAVRLLSKAGAILCNQTPIIRGVNDSPLVLQKLLRRLSFLGIPPYYVFQCRPSTGNKMYAVTVEEGYDIFERAKNGVAGVAKRARYVMSHASGKIEVVGKAQGRVFFRYHMAARPEDNGKFLSYRSNPEAFWLDDYRTQVRDVPVVQPYQVYGPE